LAASGVQRGPRPAHLTDAAQGLVETGTSLLNPGDVARLQTDGEGDGFLPAGAHQPAGADQQSGAELPLTGHPLPPLAVAPGAFAVAQTEVPTANGDTLSAVARSTAALEGLTAPARPTDSLAAPDTRQSAVLPAPLHATGADTGVRDAASLAGAPAPGDQPGDPLAGSSPDAGQGHSRAYSAGRDSIVRFAQLAMHRTMHLHAGLEPAAARLRGAETTPNPLASYAATAASATTPQDPGLVGIQQPLTSLPLQPLANPDAWAKSLGDRMLTMSEDGFHTARIKLHPQHLGQLEIRVQMNHDTARVWFTAHHAHTRDALESAMPRLKEMFHEQGLNLMQADVDTRQQQATDGHDAFPADWNFADGDSRIPDSPAVLTLSRPAQRLLDVVV